MVLRAFICFQLFITAFCFSEAPKKRLLIVGCGASGTTYITKVLQKSGLNVGHELIQKDGLVSCFMVGNQVGPLFSTNTGDPKSKFEHIFHQIRDPLKVIRNRYSPDGAKNLDSPSWTFQRSVIPQMDRNDSLLVHCAKYYYYWNLKAEEMAEFSYCIENFESILPEFEQRLGHRIDRKILSQVSKKTNTWEKWNRGTYVDITWEILERGLPPDLYAKLRALAKRYGYIRDN